MKAKIVSVIVCGLVLILISTVLVYFDSDTLNSKVQECGQEIDKISSAFDWSKSKHLPWLAELYNKPKKRIFCRGNLISVKHVIAGKLEETCRSIRKLYEVAITRLSSTNLTFTPFIFASASHCFERKQEFESIPPQYVSVFLKNLFTNASETSKIVTACDAWDIILHPR